MKSVAKKRVPISLLLKNERTTLRIPLKSQGPLWVVFSALLSFFRRITTKRNAVFLIVNRSLVQADLQAVKKGYKDAAISTLYSKLPSYLVPLTFCPFFKVFLRYSSNDTAFSALQWPLVKTVMWLSQPSTSELALQRFQYS